MAKVKWTKLKDNPDLKEDIEQIRSRLKHVNENDTERHLADTGCSLRSIASDLNLLVARTFDRHNEQKVVE